MRSDGPRDVVTAGAETAGYGDCLESGDRTEVTHILLVAYQLGGQLELVHGLGRGEGLSVEEEEEEGKSRRKSS